MRVLLDRHPLGALLGLLWLLASEAGGVLYLIERLHL